MENVIANLDRNYTAIITYRVRMASFEQKKNLVKSVLDMLINRNANIASIIKRYLNSYFQTIKKKESSQPILPTSRIEQMNISLKDKSEQNAFKKDKKFNFFQYSKQKPKKCFQNQIQLQNNQHYKDYITLAKVDLKKNQQQKAKTLKAWKFIQYKSSIENKRQNFVKINQIKYEPNNPYSSNKIKNFDIQRILQQYKEQKKLKQKIEIIELQKIKNHIKNYYYSIKLIIKKNNLKPHLFERNFQIQKQKEHKIDFQNIKIDFRKKKKKILINNQPLIMK